MKDYLLHIGLPKTGTSALQRHYFSELDGAEISYNPPAIVGALTEALKLLDFGMWQPKDEQLLRDVLAEQERPIAPAKILISLETLSQRLGRFDFVQRGEFLKSIFPQATVLLVLRHQPALLRSLYVQYLHQHFILSPDEVFVPFAPLAFSDRDHWKTRLLIDVSDWNYSEAIRHFERLFRQQFRVLFYEDYPDLGDLGREILRAGGCSAPKNVPAPLPRTNVSFGAAAVNRIHRLSHWKVAFRSHTGFHSAHLRDLFDQGQTARFVFDAPDLGTFASRLAGVRPQPVTPFGWLDRQLFRILTREDGMRGPRLTSPYALPEPILSHLQREARRLNSSLREAVPGQTVPALYR